ncbi:AAA family ATPase [Pontibacillus salipaludis]|uniref:AAA+ ATPase domain-containing protein n=1 Tax=Pontibacillus salipaludis TaxID=1697394 RepID=A0ABQ1PI23_9BACI|nr:AAA family ATPase [Pontibacillus salipaludis]GGC97696.1 hypothetical protein GCM10011389_01040 [Pontibacillus salipaludis]
MKLVHQFIQGKQKSLVFQGAPGTGKSHLFRCAAREMKQQTIEYEENGKKWTVPITVLLLKIPELMKTIQRTFGSGRKDGLTEAKILDAITKVDVLILDEIGGERSKSDPNGFESWSGDIHYQILDHRQGGRKLYNLNYDSKSVKSKYGEVQGKRILSRMMFEAKHHHVVGPDHRIIGLK